MLQFPGTSQKRFLDSEYAFNRGWTAFKNGEGIAANPYDPNRYDVDERIALHNWEEGWLAACDAEKDEGARVP